MTEAPTITFDEPPAPRRLTRPHDGRWFGGVCAGLGSYFGISPTIYRLAFAALALAGGTGILLYLAAWLVIPDEGREQSIAEEALRNHRDRPGLAVGIGLLGLVGIVAFSNASFWPHSGNIWLGALLVGGGLVWWELHGRRPLATTATTTATGGGPLAAPGPVRVPRGPSPFGPVVGLLFASAGLIGLLAALGVGLPDLRIVLAAAVVLVGGAIAAGAATGRAIAGLVGLAILLLLALVLVLSVQVPFRGKIGHTLVAPAAASQLQTSYRHSIGNLTIDLQNTSLPEGVTRVKATLAIGDLRITVPAGVNVDVTANTHVGDVSVFDRRESGLDARRVVHEVVPGATKTIAVEAEVGIGELRVSRG